MVSFLRSVSKKLEKSAARDAQRNFKLIEKCFKEVSSVDQTLVKAFADMAITVVIETAAAGVQSLKAEKVRKMSLLCLKNMANSTASRINEIANIVDAASKDPAVNERIAAVQSAIVNFTEVARVRPGRKSKK